MSCILAVWQFDFAGQAAFAWWSVVAAAISLALIVYGLMLIRERHKVRQSVADTAMTAGRQRSSIPQQALITESVRPIFGLPAGYFSLGAGALSLMLTGLMILLKLPPRSVALIWTALLAFLAMWLIYQRVYRYLSRTRMSVLFTLRVVGLCALLLMLFEPVLAFTRGPSEHATLSVVLDASGSMSISDQPNEPNRYRQSVLAVQNVLIPRLKDRYNLRFYAYDGKHQQPIKSAGVLDGVAPGGTVTDLSAALGLALSSETHSADQIVLFSDGIHNGPVGIAAGLKGISVPVHTVRVGSDAIEPATVPDIAVVAVDGPQTATVNNVVTLTASIKSTAMSDRTVRVQLLKPGTEGSTGITSLDEQRLVLHSGPIPQTVQLKFTPEQVGRMVVRLAVPVDPGERSEANNTQDFPILVTDPKLAVLYVEGRVRPEVGPLRRSLEQDPNVQAVSMVQTVAGRFEMRGLKEGDDLAKTGGMPRTPAQWKRFKVIILGDLDASFLSAQQLKDLQQAVRDGAGLLMIGGQNAFAPGGWNKTIMTEMLPVTIHPQEPAQINQAFVPQLTGTGGTHPIFRGISNYFINATGQSAAQQMPQLSGCVALGQAKAGANILAVHPGVKIQNNPAIVLAVQQYGAGRTAAFAADTTWKWNLFLRGMGKDSPYNRFWGQMVRWLAGQEDLQKKSGASVTPMIPKERYESGEPVTLRAAVTDKEGQSTAFANVYADIQGPDKKSTRVALVAIKDQIGVYEATYQPQLAGDFGVNFGAAKDGGDLGKAESTFKVMQSAGEMEILAAKPGTLQEIAQITGGDQTDLSAISALADRLADRAGGTAVASRTTFRLYENRSFFLFFIVALTAEWFLRRKWQLQ